MIITSRIVMSQEWAQLRMSSSSMARPLWNGGLAVPLPEWPTAPRRLDPQTKRGVPFWHTPG